MILKKLFPNLGCWLAQKVLFEVNVMYRYPWEGFGESSGGFLFSFRRLYLQFYWVTLTHIQNET